MYGRIIIPGQQPDAGEDSGGSDHVPAGGNDAAHAAEAWSGELDESPHAYEPEPEPEPLIGPDLDGLTIEWGATGASRFGRYFYSTFLWRWSRVLGLAWYPPKALWIFSGLQLVQPCYRLILVDGMAHRIVNWLKEAGVNAYHAEWASPGKLSPAFAHPFLNGEAPPTLLFSNKFWLGKYVLWNDYGRDWLNKFHVVWGGKIPKGMRVVSPRSVRWVKEQLPKSAPPAVGIVPRPMYIRRTCSKFAALHKRTEAIRREKLCAVVCQLRGVGHPEAIQWALAELLMTWSEHRFYHQLDRVIREKSHIRDLESQTFPGRPRGLGGTTR